MKRDRGNYYGLILLCKDFEAYKILCRHSRELESQIELNCELPFSEEECKHFICITEEYKAPYLQNAFGADLYAEKVFYKLSSYEGYCGRTLANCGNISAVITNEVHFLDESDVEVFKVYRKAKYGDEENQPPLYFAGLENQYVVVGGTACSVLFDDAGAEFRATKDIDMVLIVEALTKEFAEKFFQFVTATKRRSFGCFQNKSLAGFERT